MPEYVIRLATLADAEPIRAIYNYYVEHSTCTYQIEQETAEERVAWLRDRSPRHPVTVAVEGETIPRVSVAAVPGSGAVTSGLSAPEPVALPQPTRGTIVAWASLSPWKSRCGYAEAAEASVYVHRDHQRRGLGRALLLDLIARGRAAGLHTIIGGASSDQTASLALQLALGFRVCGEMKEVGIKFGRRLDVTYTQFMLRE